MTAFACLAFYIFTLCSCTIYCQENDGAGQDKINNGGEFLFPRKCKQYHTAIFNKKEPF